MLPTLPQAYSSIYILDPRGITNYPLTYPRNWDIILDIFFPPSLSLTSHITTSPINPRSFTISPPHSLLTVTATTTSVQAIKISHLGYYSNFLTDSRMIFTECHCAHATFYVKPLTGSSLHPE